MTIQIAEIIAFVIILILMWCPVGKVVGWLVKSSSKIKERDRDAFEDIGIIGGDSGGKWDRLYGTGIDFLRCYSGGKKKGYMIITGWLAFKVASKWAAWQHIVRVPESMEGFPQRDWLRARWAWGSYQFTRFIVGTAANIVAGFLGRV